MWLPSHYLINLIFSTVFHHSPIFGYSDYFQIFIMISNMVVSIYITHIFGFSYSGICPQRSNWWAKSFSPF